MSASWQALALLNINVPGLPFHDITMIVHDNVLHNECQTACKSPSLTKAKLLVYCGKRQQLSHFRQAFQCSRRSSAKFAALRDNQQQCGRVAEVSTAIWLLSQLPANAAESAVDFSKGSFSTQSYVVTLGLFLISLPGKRMICFLIFLILHSKL